jgi:hypothetical protein
MVNWESEQNHHAVGLIIVQFRLAEPYEVRWIEVGRGGSAGVWMDVHMRRKVANATYEYIPAIEAVDNTNDARVNLTCEVNKLGSQTMYRNEAQLGFQDGLAEASEFHGEAADLGAVLYNCFSGQHRSLKKPSEYRDHTSSGCGLMRRDQVVQHQGALIYKRGGTRLDVRFNNITIKAIDQEHVQLGQ